MAVKIYPTRQDSGLYRFSLQLDGQTFTVRFYFNDRESFWYADFYDVNSNPVRQGIKVVIDFPLFFFVADKNKPAGTTFALDMNADGKEATLTNLGTDVPLIYNEAAA